VGLVYGFPARPGFAQPRHELDRAHLGRQSDLARPWRAWRSLNSRSEAAPFLGAICLFVMSYLGLAISLWPMIVPYKFTLWQAASSPSTQAFFLVGAVFLLPITSWTAAGPIGRFGGRTVATSAITERALD
jgi:hypothetical protein